MRIAVLPSDRSGCGFYRIIWPADAVACMGHEVEIVDGLPAEWADTPDGPRFVRALPLEADVVVAQRVFRPDILALLRSLQEQGTAIVVDIDDDLAALGPAHPVFHQLRPGNPSGKSWQVMAEAARMADMLTVSTPALAERYGGRGRVRVIPNGIPRDYLSIERGEHTDPPLIGWPGTPTTHPGDLEEVGSAVADLCHSGLARFRAIGDRRTLDVLGVPDQEHRAGVPLADLSYAREVARLDIGIAPLQESVFNRSKSWLKPLEMAALRVAFVASTTAEYERFRAMGAGLSARRPRDWWRQLRILATDPDTRLALAAAGHAVAATMTIEDWVAPQALEAWTAARERRSSFSPQIALR